MMVRAMPSGTVTFFFSDIEGSTVRWERDRVAMAEALRRHDAILRESIERYGGYVFKTIGDAFCASFARAEEAANASIAAHRGLAREDFSGVEGIRVRIAIHVGATDERDGDYFGPTVNRVARLLATGHAGQTILSAAATDLVRDALPVGATLLDLGVHRLKDLTDAETIAQLCVPDLDCSFPALRSVASTQSNLPTQLVPLVGRADVLRSIGHEMEKHRVVTLVGEGGIGKTRTALQFASDALGRYDGGVWFVALSSVTETANAMTQMLADLGLRELPGRGPLESAILFLASREALLVFDNCEQIVGEAARIVREIVERCPTVRVLSTSREPLGIYGERVLRIPSLSVPPAGETLSAVEARAFEAIALFEARASAADARFALTDDNATTIGEICRSLDGIALAIELAASRIKILTPVQILAKLAERFRLLTGGRRNAETRQSTLHAAIAWSYDLLSERDRTVFERDGVFASSWSLEAAIFVCADETSDEFEVIDAVEALVNKSLVAVEGDADARAYRLLESTRSFALLRLSERGSIEALRERHAAYALRVARRLDADYLSLPSVAWERCADDAIADLRAAIAFAFEDDRDLETGIAIVANLRWYWSAVALSEGRMLVRRALDVARRSKPSREILGKLAIAEAVIATGLGAYAEQREAAARARAHWCEAGDALEIAIADRTYGQALFFLGEMHEAAPVLETALAVFRSHECGAFASLALDTLGVLHLLAGNLRAARDCLEEAIAIARARGFERVLLFYKVNLAEVEAVAGNLDVAIALCRSSLEQTYAKRELYLFALASCNLSLYYGRAERFDESFATAEAAFAYARECGAGSFEALALQGAAGVHAARGDAELAATLAGCADAHLAETGFTRGPIEIAHYDALLARARLDAGDVAIEAALARGRSTSLPDAAALSGI